MARTSQDRQRDLAAGRGIGARGRFAAAQNAAAKKASKAAVSKHTTTAPGKKSKKSEQLSTTAAAAVKALALGDCGPGPSAQIREQSKAMVDPAAQKTLIDAFVGFDGYTVPPAAKAVLASAPEQAWLPDSNGVTPFVTACAYGVVPAVKELVAAGADPNSTDPDGQTALSWAACFDSQGFPSVTHGRDRDLNDQMGGKGEVVALLAPSCNPTTVQQAITTARQWHATFRDDLDYHRNDQIEARREQADGEDDEDEEDEDDVEDDEDVQRFQDLVMTTQQMIQALESAH